MAALASRTCRALPRKPLLSLSSFRPSTLPITHRILTPATVQCRKKSDNSKVPHPALKEGGTLSKPPAEFVRGNTRMPEFSLKDRVILVSGGARGLGLTQAEALMEAGATVYVLDRLPEPSDEFFVVRGRARNELGTDIHYRQIDVTKDQELKRIVADIGEKHGRLDGLIAAAGINKEGDSLEYTTEDFNHILNVNVTGVFTTAQAVASEMVKRGNGGSMAFIASMSGTIANRGLICAAYNASKAAVVQLGRNLAMEWGAYGIRVNTISPGYIVTPMTKHDFKGSKERETFLADQNMLGRLSETREYRGAAVFLLSEASSFMTGSDLIIDGGHHSW